MREKRRKVTNNQKVKIRYILITALLGIIVGCLLSLAFVKVVLPKEAQHKAQIAARRAKAEEKKKEAEAKPKIYPTIYISGSGGSPLNKQGMTNISPVNKFVKDDLLTVLSSGDRDDITVTGSITKGDEYPMVSYAYSKGAGLKGTNNGEDYVPGLEKTVKYLQKKYDVPWINLIGHSSGATAVAYYLVDYSKAKGMPKVNKFVSFDGEFNTNTPLQPGETLSDILLSGPSVKTPMYNYIANDYQKIDPETKVLMLAGIKDPVLQTDGYLYWADCFALNHIFAENGNPLTAQFYNTTLSHGHDTYDPTADNILRNFLYADEIPPKKKTPTPSQKKVKEKTIESSKKK